MRTAHGSSRPRGRGLCLSACWDKHPPGVGLETPLGVDLETPGCGLENPQARHAGIPPPPCIPARHAGIPPSMHAGIPPPCGQNSWHMLMKIVPSPKLHLRVVTRMHSGGMYMYRPVVDCIPACTEEVVGVSQHALGRGLYPSTHWAGGGVSARGVSARGCVADTPREQNDRQV